MPVKIVFLEDNSTDVILVKRALPQQWSVAAAKNKAEFEAALTQDIDIVLLDLDIPGYDGMEALRNCKRRLPRVPVIVLSGSVSDEYLTEAIMAGATDAIAKDRMSRLTQAIKRAHQEALMMEKVLRDQRIENVSNLAGGICHDLNNVFAPVMLMLGMMSKELPEARRVLVDKAMGVVARGSEMVNQILSFAKGVTGMRVTVHLPQLVKQVTSLLRETFPKSIELREFVVGSGPPISGNPTQLYQVLINLCVNARDAMPSGGCLTIIVDWPNERGSLCRVQVKDTGTGIPEDLMAKIFLPFFTTKSDGTGLGLAMATEIIKAHGGFIEVASVRAGQGSVVGTTFAILLPVAIMIERKTDPECPVEVPNGKGETILVVDDEESILVITEDLLTHHNYRALVANNAIKGLEIFTGPERDNIRLVITDQFMPLLTGREFIERIKRLSPETKCIAVTGGDSRTLHEQTDYYLQKPYQVAALLTLIRKALDSP